MYGWTASVHWLVGRQGTAGAHVGLGWRRCPDGGIDVSRPGGLLMNNEEIWFTTRHVAGSGGVAAQEKWSALVLPSRQGLENG